MSENKKNRRQMTSKELENIRQDLLERKKILWNRIMQELEEEADQRAVRVVDTIHESGDRALEELFESNLLHLVEMKANELENIEAALHRMDTGDFGRCVDCGRWIRPARLEVMPYTIRCRRCQEDHERIENV